MWAKLSTGFRMASGKRLHRAEMFSPLGYPRPRFVCSLQDIVGQGREPHFPAMTVPGHAMRPYLGVTERAPARTPAPAEAPKEGNCSVKHAWERRDRTDHHCRHW